MSQYAGVKATINANIKTNNNEDITGLILNSVLNEMVDNLAAGYLFKGVASPSTNPGTPDEKAFYIAFDPGTYSHFGNTIVGEGQIGLFSFGSSWSYVVKSVSAPIADNLTTNDSTSALSAAQGYLLGQLLGLSDSEVVDAVATDLPTALLKTIPATIVNGRTYRIGWTGATPNVSVLSVSFGTESSTSQTTPLNLTTLTMESGYVEVTASVQATHLRIVSRDPVVSSVTLYHMEQATGVLDHLEDSLFNSWPVTYLAWVDNSAMSVTNGKVASNTNCICSRIFLPVSRFATDGKIKFEALTANTYNFAISLYSAATENSHLARIGFTTDKEIDISSYANAAYFRISLVYKDPTNTTILSAGIAEEFDLQNLYLLAPSDLQEISIPANTSVRVARQRSEILHTLKSTAMAQGQGFCKYGDYWLVGISSGTSFSSGSSSSNYINIYDSSFSLVGRIKHNLGHVSCLSYCEVFDSFITSNGNAGEYPRVDILLNASVHITAALASQTSEYMYGASDVLSIPLHTSAKDIYEDSDAGVWCFGGNGRYVYLSVRNRTTQTRRFYKGILGVGTADFSDTGTTDVTKWGTFLSGKAATEYNGTLKILETYEGDNISSAQGIDYRNGRLILSSGSTRMDVNVLNLYDGKYQVTGLHRISKLNADGSQASVEPEDLTIVDGRVFVNSSIGMFEIFI